MPKSVNKTKHLDYTTMAGGDYDEDEEEIMTDSFHCDACNHSNNNTTKFTKDLIDLSTGSEEDIINRNIEVREIRLENPCTSDQHKPCLRGSYHEDEYITDTGECSACPMLDEEPIYQEHTLEVYDTSVFKQDECLFGVDRGFHIVVLSLVAIPFVFLITCVISGYLGVLTWYNVFLHYYEQRGVFCRITVCPFLILIFPPVLVIIILGLSTYTAIGQLSWFLSAWKASISDFEKGFFAWLCIYLELKECCPYEVIVITEEEDVEGFADEVAGIGESTPPITPV